MARRRRTRTWWQRHRNKLLAGLLALGPSGYIKCDGAKTVEATNGRQDATLSWVSVLEERVTALEAKEARRDSLRKVAPVAPPAKPKVMGSPGPVRRFLGWFKAQLPG